MGQSSNDVFPSAVHLAALEQTSADLLPAIDALVATLDRKGSSSPTTSSPAAPT